MGNSTLISRLEGIRLSPGEPIGPRTTFRIGGPAGLMVFPASIDEMRRVVAACLEEATPLRILGMGANLLVGDGGFPGVVASLERMDRLAFIGDRAVVEAGYSFPRLVQKSVWLGLGGLEGLGGIPATVGGAIFMNAGGRFGEIFDVVETVTAMDPLGVVQILKKKEIPFRYRRSGLDGMTILGATLRLRPDDPSAMKEKFVEVVRKKRQTQPMSEPSAGCIFKNPPGSSAGRLIEACGLKGARVGGAAVSSKHANFIVNGGGARAEEVIRLIDMVRDRVLKEAGRELELEVKLW
jgi:UDP-N-acetylmuramate dehydrogenase